MFRPKKEITQITGTTFTGINSPDAANSPVSEVKQPAQDHSPTWAEAGIAASKACRGECFVPAAFDRSGQAEMSNPFGERPGGSPPPPPGCPRGCIPGQALLGSSWLVTVCLAREHVTGQGAQPQTPPPPGPEEGIWDPQFPAGKAVHPDPAEAWLESGSSDPSWSCPATSPQGSSCHMLVSGRSKNTGHFPPPCSSEVSPLGPTPQDTHILQPLPTRERASLCPALSRSWGLGTFCQAGWGRT